MCAKSFAWAEAGLILSSIKKTVLDKGRGSCVGREGPSAGAPHLSQPHPFHLMHKPPPSSKPLAPKPACLFLITSLHGRRGRGETQGVIGVMEGNPGWAWALQVPRPRAVGGLHQAAETRRRKRKMNQPVHTPCNPVPGKQLSTPSGLVHMPKGGKGAGLTVLASLLCDFRPVT